MASFDGLKGYNTGWEQLCDKKGFAPGNGQAGRSYAGMEYIFQNGWVGHAGRRMMMGGLDDY